MKFLKRKRFELFSKKEEKFFSKAIFATSRLKVGIIVLIIISFFLLNLPSFSQRIRNFFYTISEPIQGWLWQKGGGLFDFFDWLSKAKIVWQENESLKLENQELIQKSIELEQLRRENDVLRGALDLDLAGEFELIISDIIGREISEDYLIIDKGSKDGVVFGFPVITQQKSLVGKVIQVYETTSKIQLLSSENSSFDVKILEKEIYGLIKGKGNFNLSLEFIPREQELKARDKVITTSLGGNFPKGLLVGEIKEIKKSDISSFQEAVLEPGFDSRKLDYLFLITNF